MTETFPARPLLQIGIYLCDGLGCGLYEISAIEMHSFKAKEADLVESHLTNPVVKCISKANAKKAQET